MDFNTFLSAIPDNLALVPVSGKRPLRTGWQSQPAIPRDELVHILQQGETLQREDGSKWLARYTGVGIRLGRVSGGILAFDVDGSLAHYLISVLFLGKAPPKTWATTSGRPGRYCMFFSVPQQYWDSIETRKIPAKLLDFFGAETDQPAIDSDGKADGIELRWDGLQQVVFGQHPDTGKDYQWLPGCSPGDVDLAIAPDCLIEAMLKEDVTLAPKSVTSDAICDATVTHSNPDGAKTSATRVTCDATPERKAVNQERAQSWAAFSNGFTLPCDEIIPLEICLAQNSRQALLGRYTGGRNDTGASLARDLLGTASQLEALGQRFFGDPEKMFLDWCSMVGLDKDSPKGQPRSIWKSAQKSNPSSALDPDKLGNCIKAWAWNQIKDSRQQNHQESNQEDGQSGNTQPQKTPKSVTSDAICDATVTHSNPDGAKTSATRVTCDATQREISAFLQSQASPVFLPEKWLPKDLADRLINDAKFLNIDPVCFWQYLMPAVSSLMGADTCIDARGGFIVPNIIWSLLLERSGGGKTRAKNVIMSAIDRWQQLAKEKYDSEFAEYKASQGNGKKGESGQNSVEKPVLRKYVFNVATPQALVKRLSEQDGNGCVLVRDELKGLFKSLDQFTGEGEGLEILLESWDGKGCSVDRVEVENSYYIPESRLSIGGGLQPGIFSKVFADPDDSQGVLARFNIAVPQQYPAKRIIGDCKLTNYLPMLYQWVNNQNWGTMRFTQDADDAFTLIYEKVGNEKAPNESTRAWMAKQAGQILRICIPLHAMECYHDRTRDPRFIHKDTLLKAYEISQYYKACLLSLQGVTNNDMSGILAKIQAKAVAAEEPLAMADLYRNIRAIKVLAKEEGGEVSRITLNLCKQLEELGKGKVTFDGRKYLYSAEEKGVTRHTEAANVYTEGETACGSTVTNGVTCDVFSTVFAGSDLIPDDPVIVFSSDGQPSPDHENGDSTEAKSSEVELTESLGNATKEINNSVLQPPVTFATQSRPNSEGIELKPGTEVLVPIKNDSGEIEEYEIGSVQRFDSDEFGYQILTNNRIGYWLLNEIEPIEVSDQSPDQKPNQKPDQGTATKQATNSMKPEIDLRPTPK